MYKEIEKLKKTTFLENVDIDKAFASNKASSSEENYKIRPLCITKILPGKKNMNILMVLKLNHGV